ncbi:MAG: hypothetical protein AAF544_13295, partial [Bacteroidota bacterium]
MELITTYRLLNVIWLLGFIFISCRGDDHAAYNKRSDIKVLETNNSVDDRPGTSLKEGAYPFPELDNQISDVVRTIYQDRSGNIW